jgi:CDP-glucose 4,6-dehydratase
MKKSSKNFHEASLLKLDCSKAYSLLQWHSIDNVGEAIKKTVGWYKKYYEGVKDKELYDFTLSQIIEYAQKGGY